VKACSTSPTRVVDSPTAAADTPVTKLRTPSLSRSSLASLLASRSVPKRSLRKSASCRAYPGIASMSWETWSTKSEPKAVTSTTTTPTRTAKAVAVAGPRRQPRRAR
jgi:hypothetical protein